MAANGKAAADRLAPRRATVDLTLGEPPSVESIRPFAPRSPPTPATSNEVLSDSDPPSGWSPTGKNADSSVRFSSPSIPPEVLVEVIPDLEGESDITVSIAVDFPDFQNSHNNS